MGGMWELVKNNTVNNLIFPSLAAFISAWNHGTSDRRALVRPHSCLHFAVGS